MDSVLAKTQGPPWSRIRRHHTQGPVLGLTGKSEGPSALLLHPLSMLIAPQPWGPSPFRTGSVPSAASPTSPITWEQQFRSPGEVVRMKEAVDRKTLVQSMARSSHSTNTSFFPSCPQIPRLHAASRTGGEPYVSTCLKEVE